MDGVSAASDEGDFSVDWDFDVQMATALSLSANIGDDIASMEDAELEAALELSRMANTRPRTLSCRLRLTGIPD